MLGVNKESQQRKSNPKTKKHKENQQKWLQRLSSGSPAIVSEIFWLFDFPYFVFAIFTKTIKHHKENQKKMSSKSKNTSGKPQNEFQNKKNLKKIKKQLIKKIII